MKPFTSLALASLVAISTFAFPLDHNSDVKTPLFERATDDWRVVRKSLFEAQLDLAYTVVDPNSGVSIDLLLSTPGFCETDEIEHYISKQAGPFGIGTTNLGHLVDDLDEDGEDASWRTNMAMWSINEVMGKIQQEQGKVCFGGPDALSNASSLVFDAANYDPLVREGRHLNVAEGNKGAITLNLIKGTGALLTVAFTFGAYYTTGEVKNAITITTFTISLIITVIVSIIAEWVKNNGKFNKRDALLVKMFGEAALKMYEDAGKEKADIENQQCPAPDVMTSQIRQVTWSSNPLFHVTSQQSIAAMVTDLQEQGTSKCKQP